MIAQNQNLTSATSTKHQITDESGIPHIKSYVLMDSTWFSSGNQSRYQQVVNELDRRSAWSYFLSTTNQIMNHMILSIMKSPKNIDYHTNIHFFYLLWAKYWCSLTSFMSMSLMNIAYNKYGRLLHSSRNKPCHWLNVVLDTLRMSIIYDQYFFFYSSWKKLW